MILNPIKNHNSPPVSVIILTYNGSKYIGPLLESLQNQTYPRNQMEIIVVDNASTDNTVNIIQENYPFINIISLKKNIGFAAGNNQGLLHAQYDLLVFLNQDTLCHREWLSVLVDTMVKDNNIAACNPNIITAQFSDAEGFEAKPLPDSLHLYDLSPFGYARKRELRGKPTYHQKLLSGCSFIIKREVITRLGYLFDEKLWMYAEDTDLSLRLHQSGHKICAVRNALVYHLHNTAFKFNREILRTAVRAIINRVLVYYKNMNGIEFLLFLPLLFIGGNFKIFEFNTPAYQKILLFLPYSIFSMTCMIIALVSLPKYAARLKRSSHGRKKFNFVILKLLLH